MKRLVRRSGLPWNARDETIAWMQRTALLHEAMINEQRAMLQDRVKLLAATSKPTSRCGNRVIGNIVAAIL